MSLRRPAVTALVLASLLGATPAAAQATASACGALPKRATNNVAVEYGTTRLAHLTEAYGDVWRAETAVSLGRQFNPWNIVGADAHGSAHAGYARGMVDVREDSSGISDKAFDRLFVAYEITHDLKAVLPGLRVCSHVGAELTYHAFEAFPRRYLAVPISVAFGFTKETGSIAVTPYIAPSIAYYTARHIFVDSATVRFENTDAGRDMAIAAGTTLRLGRMVVNGMVRYHDHEVRENLQMIMSAGLWF